MLGLFGILVIATVSVYAIPSLKARMGYFQYEWTLIRDGQLNAEHSDAQRLLSMQYGIQVARTQPLIGVGAGDIRNEMNDLYTRNAQEATVKSKMPHNQFIYMWAATGIIGVCVFLISALYPWFSRKRYKHMLFTVFLSMMLFAFMAEHTLEIQLGTAYYLLFLLLIRKYIDDTQQVAHA